MFDIHKRKQQQSFFLLVELKIYFELVGTLIFK
jgi:hypothetical protein